MDWGFKVQYSANFNYTSDNFYCSGHKTELTPLALAWAPKAEDTSITIINESFAEALESFSPPYQLFAWNRYTTEIVNAFLSIFLPFYYILVV